MNKMLIPLAIECRLQPTRTQLSRYYEQEATECKSTDSNYSV